MVTGVPPLRAVVPVAAVQLPAQGAHTPAMPAEAPAFVIASVRALSSRFLTSVPRPPGCCWGRPAPAFTLVHAGRLHWMDEDGRVLGEETRAVAPEVPVISGLSEEELAAMRTAPGPKARAAIALIRALLRSGSTLTAEISEIDMSRAEGPVLYTVDGVEVRLGAEQWDERLARLEGVLAQVATEDVNGVDLRFADQVVLKRGAR